MRKPLPASKSNKFACFQYDLNVKERTDEHASEEDSIQVPLAKTSVQHLSTSITVSKYEQSKENISSENGITVRSFVRLFFILL